MQLDDPLMVAPALEEAIDRHPLTVAPDRLLKDVIALMSQARGTHCSVASLNPGSDEGQSMRETRSSCVLVMQGSELLGIFTERDIVRLTADGVHFEGVKIAQVMTHSAITLPSGAFQDIFAALFLFRRYRIRHLPILDSQGFLVGIISPESIRQVLRPANLLKLRRVSEVMTRQVIHGPLTTSVLNLARLMADNRVSCVVITQEDADGVFMPVGIVTERDIMQFQSLQLDLCKTEAQAVMSTPLFLLSPSDSLWTAHDQMQQRRVRRLVVSWNWGRSLGIVTQTSLLRIFDPMEMYGVIETLQRTVEQLEVKQDVRSQNGKASSDPDIQLSTLLGQIQVSIESLVSEPNISPKLQQDRLNSTLADLQQIRYLMQSRSVTVEYPHQQSLKHFSKK